MAQPVVSHRQAIRQPADNFSVELLQFQTSTSSVPRLQNTSHAPCSIQTVIDWGHHQAAMLSKQLRELAGSHLLLMQRQ
jgi:hypothetical protein